MAEKDREFGASTEPGANYMDKVQKAEETTVKSDNVKVDKKAAIEFIDPEPVEEPKQVEPTEVIFVPHKNFEARVNQDTFWFRKDVPTRVSRDMANMLLEDRERGYIKD